MISNEKLGSITEDMKNKGFEVRIRDIAYVLLCSEFEDKSVVYASFFGSGTKNEIDAYEKSPKMTELKKCMGKGKTKTATNEDDITFKENKAYMLKLKKETEEAMAKGDIDKKDGLKILTDISTKLNDKFAVSESNIQQYVVVNQKFNAICDCGKEIYIPTKEDLMKKYNLVEKT